MTNLEKWRYYLQDYPSPDSFINWGFYSMIASSLQRRVWYGNIRNPLFCNLYTVLAGPPAIGKGLIIGEVNKALRFHKKGKANVEETDAINVKESEESGKEKMTEKLLIPIGAEATSYQALVRELSKYIQIKWFFSEKYKKNLPYPHSSLTFCLEELSSLFRKHTEDLVAFLLCTYDCKDYRYDCIGRGTDAIKNPCVNLLAGTTPGFIKRIFGDELITDGFASRTVFLSEEKNRFPRFSLAKQSEEQIKGYNEVLEHIKKLTTLYGEIKVEPETTVWLQHWFETEHQNNKPNNSPKLAPYYGRKNITIQKLAAVLHFSDSLAMEVSLEEHKRAIVILGDAEKRMHLAVNVGDKNPIAEVTDQIEKYLTRNGPVKKRKLLIDFWSQLPEREKSLDEVLDFLMKTEKIKYYTDKVAYGRIE